jgi:hypothetical protein
MVAMVSFDFHFQIAYFWMRDKGPRTTRLMNVVTQIGTAPLLLLPFVMHARIRLLILVVDRSRVHEQH